MTIMKSMAKSEAIATIKAFKKKIPCFVTEVDDETIETTVYMIDEMTVVPRVRPIIDDELYGNGVVFDYDEKGGLSVEITVVDSGTFGFISYNDDNISTFKFENVEETINFWNVIVGKAAKG